VEGGIEQYYAALLNSPAAPAVADLTITRDLPWNFSPETQALALGNPNLDVETVTGWEWGYKGSAGKFIFTVDAYVNRMSNFVTDLLPGVNPLYPSYGLTDEVNVPAELQAIDARLAALGIPANSPLRASIPQLLGAYSALQAGTQLQGANALATLPGGTRAVVLSYTNAGKVTEQGIELGLGYQISPELRGDVSFTGFDFDVDSSSTALGDQLVPNTPGKKMTVSVSYAGHQGLDGNVTVRLIDGYPWAAGVFQGYVPAATLINVSAGYQINNYFRVHATATNLLDQQRYQLFGGSVIGRRVLGGVTANF
jgi:outer membrane receptor protein involved in Fe transport